MCFSASASFGASALLMGLGAAAVKKTDTSREYAFASIPIIFSVQQLSEGFLWLALTNPDYASLQMPATYTFMFFAEFLWPFWVPLAVWLMERDPVRRKLLFYLMLIGGALALFLGYCIVAYDLDSAVRGRHINYIFYWPLEWVRVSIYFIATVVPIFISSYRYMWVLGGAISLSLVLSYIFFTEYVVSVWCFFAAILSALILFIIAQDCESPLSDATFAGVEYEKTE